MSYINFKEELLGMPTIGRSVTATLYVSPNGDNSDGSSWERAYTTLQGALTAASTDVNECTLILVGINTGPNYYDINTTGDPTFTGNYIIKGTHRNWQKIRNDHDTATSILKFTGYTSLIDLNFNLGEGNGNGVIITKGASRIYHCQFVGSGLTGAATALHYDGATQLKHHKMSDCDFRGHVTHMTGILVDKSCCSDYDCIDFHHCKTAIQIVDALSDENTFKDVDIGDCALGLDIDAGNEQHFINVVFHDNVANVDDIVGDHMWVNIDGELSVTTEPDNFAGVAVATGNGANVWTAADVEVRAAITSTIPFRIVGINLEADSNEKFRIRLTDGTTYFSDTQFEGVALGSKASSLGVPSGTEFIFNKGTQIKASTKSESAGVDTVLVWLQIQEIG